MSHLTNNELDNRIKKYAKQMLVYADIEETFSIDSPVIHLPIVINIDELKENSPARYE